MTTRDLPHREFLSAMKEIGKIIEFTSEGKAVVEFETKVGACKGCACAGVCSPFEEKKRMTMEVIPGVALGSRVHVDIGRPSLLRWPTLAYVMIATFLAGALLGQLIGAIAGSKDSGLISIMAGLILTALCIVALNIDEHRRGKETFVPHIIGVMWRASSGKN